MSPRRSRIVMLPRLYLMSPSFCSDVAALDADTTHAKYRCKEFVGEVERIRARAVLRHQKPARQAGLDDVETVARDRIRELGHPHVEVTIQRLPEGGALCEVAPKRRGVHAQRGTCALDQRPEG